MTPAPDHNPNRPDALGAYADGARDAVDAVRPDEPSDEQWDAVLRAVRSRLAPPATPRPQWRWRAARVVGGGLVLAAVAAAAAWVAFGPVAVKDDATASRPVPPAPPAPEAQADPLAEFDVLPMATAEEVDLRRVPGAGWLPVGTDPLPDVLTLATAQEVELEAPNSAWPEVAPAPTDAPMIFAAKPR